MTPDILQAALEERYRLEARLRSNPDFRRLEAVRRIIALYASAAEIPAAVDPISFPEPAASTIRSAPRPNPDLSPTISSSDPLTPPDPPVSPIRGGWTRGNSQRSRILAAAVEHLRETRKRATGTEIYKAIAAKGVQVNGKKPAAVVAANLSSAESIFDRTIEGYGLREWSNGGAPSERSVSVG